MATEIVNKNDEKTVTENDDDKRGALEEDKLDEIGVNEAAVIPKGTLDPVYEAKVGLRYLRFVFIRTPSETSTSLMSYL
jgi:hypothetical protein